MDRRSFLRRSAGLSATAIVAAPLVLDALAKPESYIFKPTHSETAYRRVQYSEEAPRMGVEYMVVHFGPSVHFVPVSK